MRIGYIISSFPAGSETFVVNDIRGLEALGHEVTALALGGADPTVAGNPNYAIKGRIIRVKGLGLPLWRKVQKLTARRRLRLKYGQLFAQGYDRRPVGMSDELWTDRLTWDAAINQIDAGKFDFLHVHFAMRQLLLGYHAARLLDIPLSLTMAAHDIFVNPLASLFPQTLGQCAFIVTVSDYNRQEILRLAPALDPTRLHVMANGVDVDAFTPAYHDPGQPFAFASTGRLVEIKGFHVLVEAAGILAARGRDFVVRIVGEGPLRHSMSKRIGQLGLGSRFELLGRKDATFLRDWLPRQDCFVLPCVIAKDGNRDGMPVALREGMACGLPALTTRLLGLHEAVVPGTGLLVEAGDPQALAIGMEAIMDLSPAEHRAMAQAARHKAQSEFSLVYQVGWLETWMKQEIQRWEARSCDHPLPAVPSRLQLG